MENINKDILIFRFYAFIRKKIGKISGYFGRNINEMETFKLIEILGKKTSENDQINKNANLKKFSICKLL